MRIAHILKKYTPGEWGGTETAILQSLNALREHEVLSVVCCPKVNTAATIDPLAKAGHAIQRFQAYLPIWGLTREKCQELTAFSNNLISFELSRVLRNTPALDLIHTHAIGGLGVVSRKVARLRKIPCVVSWGGDAVNFPESTGCEAGKRPLWSCDWGKLFRSQSKSRRLLEKVDAIVVNNPNEAAILSERYPYKRIHFQPQGIAVEHFETDFRAKATAAFPEIAGKQVLLCPTRIDPYRNQQWLLHQLPAILACYPDVLMVFAGACTDEQYGSAFKRCIEELGLQKAVLITGSLPPNDPRLIGLFQCAKAMIMPSIVSTSGIAILEAWASGLPVLANRTSGTSALIRHNEDGWFFDIPHPHTLHEGLRHVFSTPDVSSRFAATGRRRVQLEFNSYQLAGKLKALYEELIDAKLAQNHYSEPLSGYVGPSRVSLPLPLYLAMRRDRIGF